LVNGLGLRIVQLITKLHEAKLTLRNKSEGGAEVLLKLKAFTDLA
jgi:K+-sensing histidine kinase KdpD